MARPFVVRLVVEDVRTKLLALLLAVVLWLAVTFLGSRTVMVEGVAVGIVNLPENVAVASDIAPVRVKIRAPRTLLRERPPAEFLRAFVDLAGRGIGEQSAEVIVSPTDPRVDVVIVLPSRITVSLDPVVVRSLPVKVIPEGTPAEGFTVGEAEADPTSVEVRGALAKLQETPAIEVQVPVGGAQANIEGEFTVSPPAGLSVTPDRVRVKLAVLQAEETRTLGVRVVTRGVPASGHWVRAVSTDPSAVTVRGPREALGDRTFLETVSVDVDEARSPIERAVELALPEKLAIVGGEPRVRVKVDIAPLEGTKDVNAAVQVREVGEGLRVMSVSPGTLRVTIRGEKNALDGARDEDVRIAISASGRGAGSFTTRPSPADVQTPGGVTTVSVENVEVHVTLEGS